MKSRHIWTNAIILIIHFFQSECMNLVISYRPIHLRKEILQADE